ncbi:MAG: FtsX-like permease family protein [Candidatus Eisenbacteria bacterium]|nr:FtsX-like permease family protein [Candidatus Eisenbacteria bacterium]
MMVFREFAGIAAGNLWRLKLRTSLTALGVMIGIAALVTMLSFAAGVQRNVAERFRALGLFHTLHVMPPILGEGADPAGADSLRSGTADSLQGGTADSLRSGTADSLRSGTADSLQSRTDDAPPDATVHSPRGASPEAVRLDDAMLARLAEMEGVSSVHPQDSFDAQLIWGAESLTVSAQSLPAAFVRSRDLGRLVAGDYFDSDEARLAVLRPRTVERLGADPDSILGQTVRLRIASRGEMLHLLFERILARLELPPEAAAAARRIAGALLSHRRRSEIALRVCGVAELEGGWGFRMGDLLVPGGVVAGIDRISFRDPFEMISQLTVPGGGEHALAIVTFSEEADPTALQDAIEALGLRTFSFIEQFEEMRRGFLVFDLMVSVIGLIALLVASLGIVNTMVMSITERTREIGILKSLGAEGRQIRLLFLIESGMIGLVGSLVGLLVGWGLSRIGSLILRQIMAAEGAPRIDLFHLHPLVAVGAVAFGLLLSLLAGVHPAARAARIDPVRALRHE